MKAKKPPKPVPRGGYNLPDGYPAWDLIPCGYPLPPEDRVADNDMDRLFMAFRRQEWAWRLDGFPTNVFSWRDGNQIKTMYQDKLEPGWRIRATTFTDWGNAE